MFIGVVLTSSDYKPLVLRRVIRQGLSTVAYIATIG